MTKSVTKYEKSQEALVNARDGFGDVIKGAATPSLYDGNRNIAVRPPFSRQDYEAFRPNEAIPRGKTQQDLRSIMIACQNAYESVGVIRSVIDMMAEFVAEGIDITHPDAKTDEFYKLWKIKVNLSDRAQQFAKWALKSGNVVVKREFTKLNNKNIKQLPIANAGKIPLRYIFYNPANIEAIGDFISTVADNKLYGLRLPLSIFSTFANPKNDLEKKVYNSLPQEVKDAIKNKTYSGTYYIPLPSDQLHVAHLNKDDTDIWATPFTYGVLADVFYNDKLKQAKVSALDGIINYVRLWKLGDHTKDLLPSPAAATKLANIIANHTGGGGMDIVWSSDINLEEFYPPVDKLVGFEEKYNTILVGLGVPITIVGGDDLKASNNAGTLGLKNMLSRIESVRRMLITWLQEEIAIIQKNMGFKVEPTIRFTYANFFDERIYFTLLKDLVDRNVIDDSRILEAIKEDPKLIKKNIQKQEEERKAGDLPPKASPFHTPQMEEQQTHEIKKIKVQNSVKEQAGSQGQNSHNLTQKVNKSVPNGRPPGSKDKLPRTVTKGALLIKANEIFNFVDNYVTDLILKEHVVADIRSLSAKQKKEIEDSKLFILPLISPTTVLNEVSFIEAYQKQEGPTADFNNNLKELIGEAKLERVSFEQKKLFIIQAYVNAWENYVNNYVED
jgi:hypothetical protein